MTGPVVRAATGADAEAVAELERIALGRDAWSPELVRQGVSGAVPTATYLVAELAGQVIGHAVVSVAGDLAELQRIGVAAAHRRRGVATALLAEAARLAERRGADRLLLEVREDNAAALACYAANGLVEVDRRPRYYRDGAAAVVLRRSLGGGCGQWTT